jgi:hypothetical protein
LIALSSEYSVKTKKGLQAVFDCTIALRALIETKSTRLIQSQLRETRLSRGARKRVECGFAPFAAVLLRQRARTAG